MAVKSSRAGREPAEVPAIEREIHALQRRIRRLRRERNLELDGLASTRPTGLEQRASRRIGLLLVAVLLSSVATARLVLDSPTLHFDPHLDHPRDAVAAPAADRLRLIEAYAAHAQVLPRALESSLAEADVAGAAHRRLVRRLVELAALEAHAARIGHSIGSAETWSLAGLASIAVGDEAAAVRRLEQAQTLDAVHPGARVGAAWLAGEDQARLEERANEEPGLLLWLAYGAAARGEIAAASSWAARAVAANGELAAARHLRDALAAGILARGVDAGGGAFQFYVVPDGEAPCEGRRCRVTVVLGEERYADVAVSLYAEPFGGDAVANPLDASPLTFRFGSCEFHLAPAATWGTVRRADDITVTVTPSDPLF